MKKPSLYTTNKITAASLAILFLASTLFPLHTPPKQAQALSGSSWRAGRIIDDAVFFNEYTMSAPSIQNFLEARLSNCDTNGTQSRSYYYNSSTGRLNNSNDTWVTTSRATYGNRYNKWYKVTYASAPYRCLKNYSMSVPAVTNSGSDLCTGNISSGTKTAAQILYDVARACNINPQVLIVMLQKEQSLITDDWPWRNQYEKAMGYYCPDDPTRPGWCHPDYAGFFNQVYNAAEAFHRYAANPTGYNYRAQRNNTILYNPNRDCGSSTVYIENQATAGLYIYTPYQPNKAALDNLYGTGNGCSAYGNRNFWRMFNDWFGSPYINFTRMETPRWMETKVSTYKKNPANGTNVDSLIPAGTQIYFKDKVTKGGVTYLRTKHDSERFQTKGIALTDLKEVPLTYEPMLDPRWMQLKRDAKKRIPQTEGTTASTVNTGTQIFFTSKIEVGGKTYLRTQHDTTANINRGFLSSDLENSNITYADMQQPRRLELLADGRMYDIRNGEAIGSEAPAGSGLYFTKKVTINGITYLRNGAPANPDEFTGYNLTRLDEFTPVYTPLKSPRAMRIKFDTRKVDAITNLPVDGTITTGTLLYFTSKIELEGQTYVRTKADTEASNNKLLPMSILEEVPVNFVSMKKPRYMYAVGVIHKKDPVTGISIDNAIADNTKIYFTTKAEVNGVVYLRTQHDTSKGLIKGILLSELSTTP